MSVATRKNKSKDFPPKSPVAAPSQPEPGAPGASPSLIPRIPPERRTADARGRGSPTYLEAATPLADYLKQPAMPFFFWLRGIAGNMLLALHRQHLGTKMRAVGREVQIADIDRARTLTAAETKKLQLAGRGDIKRFFDHYKAVKQKVQSMLNDDVRRSGQEYAHLLLNGSVSGTDSRFVCSP